MFQFPLGAARLKMDFIVHCAVEIAISFGFL